MTRRIEIDPDIRRARTLPAWCYTDPAFFERLREALFARSWQLAAHDGVIPEPGSAYPFSLLEGCLDEPLVLTRGPRGGVHALSNVCTHRGNLVVGEPCSAVHLRCGYHGRTFGLDGRFRSMPGFEEAEDFPGPEDDLPAAQLGRLGPFHFVSLDPCRPFDAWIAGLRARIGWALADDLVFDAERSQTYEVGANWALYVDNYLEGFHIPFVHEGLNAALDFGAYEVVLERYASVQIGVASSDEACLDLPEGSPDQGKQVAAYYCWLFPNLMLNIYQWGVSVNVVSPVSERHTRVSFLTYVRDEPKLDHGAGTNLHQVEMEDEAVVEACQSGMRSRSFERGRYSPTHETGVHHFHRLLADVTNP